MHPREPTTKRTLGLKPRLTAMITPTIGPATKMTHCQSPMKAISGFKVCCIAAADYRCARSSLQQRQARGGRNRMRPASGSFHARLKPLEDSRISIILLVPRPTQDNVKIHEVQPSGGPLQNERKLQNYSASEPNAVRSGLHHERRAKGFRRSGWGVHSPARGSRVRPGH